MASKDVTQPVGAVSKSSSSSSDDVEEDGTSTNLPNSNAQTMNQSITNTKQNSPNPNPSQQNQNLNNNSQNQANPPKPQQINPSVTPQSTNSEAGVERVGKFAARKTGKRAPEVPGGAKLHNVSTPAQPPQMKTSESSTNIANTAVVGGNQGHPPLPSNGTVSDALHVQEQQAPFPFQGTMSIGNQPPPQSQFNPQMAQPVYNLPSQALLQPYLAPRMQHVQPVMAQPLTSAGLAEHNILSGQSQYPIRSQHNTTPLGMSGSVSVGSIGARTNLGAGSIMNMGPSHRQMGNRQASGGSEGGFWVDPGPSQMKSVESNISFTDSQDAQDAQVALERWTDFQRLIATTQNELQTFMITHLGRYQQQSSRVVALERRNVELQIQNEELSRRHQQQVAENSRLVQLLRFYEQQQQLNSFTQQQQQQYAQIQQQQQQQRQQAVGVGPFATSMSSEGAHMGESSPTTGLDIGWSYNQQQPPPQQVQAQLAQSQLSNLQAPVPVREDEPVQPNQADMTHLVSDALKYEALTGGGHAKVGSSPPPPPPSTPTHPQVTTPVKASLQNGRIQQQPPLQQRQPGQNPQGQQRAQPQPSQTGQPAQQQNPQGQQRAQPQPAQTGQPAQQQNPQGQQRAQPQPAQTGQTAQQQNPQGQQRAQPQPSQTGQPAQQQNPQGQQRAQPQPSQTGQPLAQQRSQGQSQPPTPATLQQQRHTQQPQNVLPQQRVQTQQIPQQQKPTTQPPLQQQPTPQNSLQQVQQAQMQVQQQHARVQVRPPTPPDEVGGGVPISHFATNTGLANSSQTVDNLNAGTTQATARRQQTTTGEALNVVEKDVDLC